MPSERKLIKILKECAASLEKGHNRHRRRRRRSRSRSRSRPRGGRSRSRSPVRREPSPPPESPPRIETEQKEDESDKVEDAVMVNPFSEALGDDYIETTKYDKSIHEDISRRWTHIIVNGLSKEQRDNITKKYKIPGNCTILEAPAINIEIKNVLGDSSKLRDKSIEIGQAQLGLATGIIGKAMTQLMENEELNKTHLISLLSDASKLLNDLNFHQTKTRKKLIIPSLDKNFIQTIEKSNRNAFLFAVNGPHKEDCHSEHKNYKVGKPQWSATSAEGQGDDAWRTEDTGVPVYPVVPSSQPAETIFFEPEPAPPSEASTEAPQCSIPALTNQNSTPAELIAFPGSRNLLRQAFRLRNLPEGSLDITIASLAASTLKQYNTTYTKWWAFCRQYKLDVYKASIPQILQFLTYRFEENASYSTLNTDRSALALLMEGSIGTDDRIARFIKGVYRLRPPIPKYVSMWDPSRVLRLLTNWPENSFLSLEKVTKKLSILLALASAQRVQTLSAIKINNINEYESKILINITDVIKTSVSTKSQPTINLPFFESNPQICPARALKAYLNKTKLIRNNEPYLWITFKKPHRRASSQSISRWIKCVMSESGIDTSTFSSHSTRHAASSIAKKRGVQWDIIRKAAGWTKNSNTFAKFYDVPIIDDSSSQGSFAMAVLGNN
ncbi:uncharacterized protein [Choristoneura fumiferana]|uniref:uncharacterized protein n=1 Tax=Choristoneura fumiferana TaxID=7141 RepID=UPI003D15D250